MKKDRNYLTFTPIEEKKYLPIYTAVKILEEKGYYVSEKELIDLSTKARRIYKKDDTYYIKSDFLEFIEEQLRKRKDEMEAETKRPKDILFDVKKASENKRVKAKGVILKENNFYKLYGENGMNIQLESAKLNDSLIGYQIEVEGIIKNRIWFNSIYPSIVVYKYTIIGKPDEKYLKILNKIENNYQNNYQNNHQNNYQNKTYIKDKNENNLFKILSIASFILILLIILSTLISKYLISK
jgi:hypothetical protein